VSRLDELLNRAKAQAAAKSEYLKTIDRALSQHARLIISNFEQKDFNNDGLLNIDGWLASMRIAEIGLENSQLTEAFYLICGPDETLAYQTWIINKSPSYKMHFTINATPRIETSDYSIDKTMPSQQQIEASISVSGQNQQMMTMNTQ